MAQKKKFLMKERGTDNLNWFGVVFRELGMQDGRAAPSLFLGSLFIHSLFVCV